MFKSKFVKSRKTPGSDQSRDSQDLYRKQSQEILKKIEKEVQSQTNRRTKVAVLDFTGFQMHDQYALLRSRSNTEFIRKHSMRYNLKSSKASNSRGIKDFADK